MKNIFNDRFVALLLVLAVAVGSCTKDNLTDGDKFMLFYPDVTDIGPSTNMSLDPTYHGAKPTDFNVYDVKYNGSTIQTECFQVDPVSGRLMIKDTEDLGVGVYTISISCKSSGTTYEYPDIITVNMMKAVPEEIVVDPRVIELLITQVNDVNSTEELPVARVTTDGDHITIKSYSIANVTRDGIKMADWEDYFRIEKNTGVISIIKNGTFVAGGYNFDLRLVTSAVNASSEEGLFVNAFTVDIVSPPLSLAYDPEVKRVEVGSEFISTAPSYVASSKDLVFAIKAIYPENVPLTIDSATGVLTLDADNGLVPGDEIQVSISLTNAYGTKNFDQITKIQITDFIQPISKLSYNDSTVWHGTAYTLKPKEVDGDDVRFSFVDLPEALSALTINEITGAIATVKGNRIEKGEYTLTVKVANDKGDMTDDIKLKVVDNPYFFTKVSWGNNLGLTPVSDYASQYRVSLTENTEIEIDKTVSDITETGWESARFEIVDGSLDNNKDTHPTYAAINSATGVITVKPASIASGKIARKRAHMIVVSVACGVGTSGETVRKVPVFFDFNAPRVDASVPNAPVYTVEFTPFVFQCNPKEGGVFVQPTFKDKDGNVIDDPVGSGITMTMHGPNTQNYWNLEGPATHLNGIPSVDGGFLHQMWTQYSQAANASPNYGNAYPVYTYLEDKSIQKYASARLGYMQDDLRMYVKEEKWVDEEGYYADGVFVSQVRMGYKGLDGVVKRADATTSPYNNLFPFFIWFDTEFDMQY